MQWTQLGGSKTCCTSAGIAAEGSYDCANWFSSHGSFDCGRGGAASPTRIHPAGLNPPDVSTVSTVPHRRAAFVDLDIDFVLDSSDAGWDSISVTWSWDGFMAANVFDWNINNDFVNLATIHTGFSLDNTGPTPKTIVVEATDEALLREALTLEDNFYVIQAENDFSSPLGMFDIQIETFTGTTLLSTSTTTINVLVVPVNDGPVLEMTFDTASWTEDTVAGDGETVPILTAAVTDVDDMTVTMTVSASGGLLDLVTPPSGSSLLGGGTGTLVITDTPSEISASLLAGVSWYGTGRFCGTETISFLVEDSGVARPLSRSRQKWHVPMTRLCWISCLLLPLWIGGSHFHLVRALRISQWMIPISLLCPRRR